MSVETTTTIKFESNGLTDDFYFKDASMNIVKPDNAIVGVHYTLWSMYDTIYTYQYRRGIYFDRWEFNSGSTSIGIFTPFSLPYDVSQVVQENVIFDFILELGTVTFTNYISNEPITVTNAQSKYCAKITITTTVNKNSKMCTIIEHQTLGFSDVYFLQDLSGNIVQFEDAVHDVMYSCCSLFNNKERYYNYSGVQHKINIETNFGTLDDLSTPTLLNDVSLPITLNYGTLNPLSIPHTIRTETSFGKLSRLPIPFDLPQIPGRFIIYGINLLSYLGNSFLTTYFSNTPFIENSLNAQSSYYFRSKLSTLVGQKGLIINNKSNSISPSTGSIVIQGGLGIHRDVNIGGMLFLNKKKAVCKNLYSVASLAFDMALGMNFNLPLQTNQFDSIIFFNIPMTSLSCYTLTFFIEQPVRTVSYYLRPPNNKFRIICKDLVSYDAICYGVQLNNFPETIDMIIQQITIINEGTVESPSFIALSSASGY